MTSSHASPVSNKPSSPNESSSLSPNASPREVVDDRAFEEEMSMPNAPGSESVVLSDEADERREEATAAVSSTEAATSSKPSEL